jgi:hypothetical protein
MLISFFLLISSIALFDGLPKWMRFVPLDTYGQSALCRNVGSVLSINQRVLANPARCCYAFEWRPYQISLRLEVPIIPLARVSF